MKTKPYTIQPGESLTDIADKHGISLETLVQLNPISTTPYSDGTELQVPDTRGIFQTMVDYVAERLSTQSKGGPVMLPLQDNSILIYLPPSAGMDDVLQLALEVEARRQPVEV